MLTKRAFNDPTKEERHIVAKHYVEVSDSVWTELVRIQKQFKVDKHALVDDIIALAGDLEAIAENHEDPVVGPIPETPVHSTRAAVLEPTAVEQELADLI